MKRIPSLLVIMSAFVLSQMLNSCGLIDFEFEEYTQEAYEMHLDKDSVYVLYGTTFNLTPIFTPDTVTNREVYWTSADNNIVWAYNNYFVTISEGETYVSAITVQNRITDSCYVKVLPAWEININSFSDDMVVYAQVSIDEAPVDTANILLGAFSGGELRGIGEKKQWKGIDYFQFHIFGHKELEPNPENDKEIIRFAYYDKQNLYFQYLSQYLLFDGETHGTLSDLYVINNNDVKEEVL